MFRMVANSSQTEKLASIYRTGNKGSANHYMLTVVYKKFVKIVKGDLEVQEVREKVLNSEPRTIKINTRHGSYIETM